LNFKVCGTDITPFTKKINLYAVNMAINDVVTMEIINGNHGHWNRNKSRLVI
jgi:hypothetical protein